jgi:hypothetical protein
MSTPEKETLEQRVQRETAELQEIGIVKRELPVIARSTFEALSLKVQAEFMRAGGRFENDPKPAPKPIGQIPAGHILRSKFDAMSPAEQVAHIKSGGKLVDDANYETAKASGSVLTRAEYRELDVRSQAQFIDAGGTVTD